MNQATPAVTVSTGTGTLDQDELVVASLRSQRERLPGLFELLAGQAWSAPTRCSEWDVHDLARHLCDATTATTELLRGQLPEGSIGFDPRTTPADWLQRSAGEAPADTLARLEKLSAELLAEIDRIRDASPDARVPFLYGSVPWSLAVLHLVWDAWVHERDVLLPAGRARAVPAVETRATAAYALLLAAEAATFFERRRPDDGQYRFFLKGEGGGSFHLAASGGTVTVTVDPTGAEAAGDEVLAGEVGEVVDSLVGREPDLDVALHGSTEQIHELGLLRRYMLARPA